MLNHIHAFLLHSVQNQDDDDNIMIIMLGWFSGDADDADAAANGLCMQILY